MKHLDPDTLLQIYAQGIFPMAEDAEDDEVFWVKPQWRGIIPLDTFHVPRSLAKFMRKNPYEIRFDTAFDQVIDLCAASADGREQTWINNQISTVFKQLHQMGHAHSVEAWRGDELVGGLYGLALNGVFCGESMVSRAVNGSKVCLVALVEHLRQRGFMLLDTQFITDHLAQFGAIEISEQDYDHLLAEALKKNTSF